MKDLISVVVPMYNAARFLDRSFASILNQTYKNLEIVVVNDGSTDNTLERVKEFQKNDNRIKIIDDTNHGVSHARNVGLQHITGDYVQFIDADDDIVPDYFETQLALMKKTGADMTVCNNDHPFFLTYLTDRVYDMTNHDEFLEFYQHTYAPTLPWNKLIKASCVKGLHFAENIKFAEDELFCCAVLRNVKKIATNSRVMYHYFLAKAENGEEESSKVNDLINASRFWDYKTSFYYEGLWCLPTRLAIFQKEIDDKVIPFTDVSEILYTRVFDYAFFQYAAYAGFQIPEENMYQEMLNIFKDAFFYASVMTQERYGLKFFDLCSKDLEAKVKEINHYIYISYQDIYRNHLPLKPTYVAVSVFTKLFVLEDNDVNNVNWVNQLDKALRENSTPEAQYVNNLIK